MGQSQYILKREAKAALFIELTYGSLILLEKQIFRWINH